MKGRVFKHQTNAKTNKENNGSDTHYSINSSNNNDSNNNNNNYNNLKSMKLNHPPDASLTFKPNA